MSFIRGVDSGEDCREEYLMECTLSANDEPEPEHCIDANQLTDKEIRSFVMDWLNDETNDESTLEFITIEAWFCDLPLSYKARKWVEKWARQAAFEAQLPPNLKRQASIN